MPPICLHTNGFGHAPLRSVPLNPDVRLSHELEPWDFSLLSSIPDEVLADDMIFGIFSGWRSG